MSSRQEELDQAMRAGDFEKFKALRPNMSEVNRDHELVYQLLLRDDNLFWDWFLLWDDNSLIEKVLYEHRDFDIASSLHESMTRYFVTLPSEERDYRYMYRVYETSGETLSLTSLVDDPFLVEIALDAGEGKYTVADIEYELECLDDSDPSDELEEAYEILEQWLEKHS